MKFTRRTIFLACAPLTFFFLLACAALAPKTPLAPQETSTPMQVIVPYETQPARPSPAPTAPPARIEASPAVFPRWVAEFSEPILNSLIGVFPTYRDDFAAICISDEQKPKVKVCSTPESRPLFQEDIWSLPVTAIPTLDLQPDLRAGYAYLNTGWFFDMPGAARNPHLARIDDGALVLRLPEGTIAKDMAVYNPNLMARNFVLQFDVEFGETQPDDAFRFQFEQGAAEGVAFELTKGKTWVFRQDADSAAPPRFGSYEYLVFPRVRVLLIVQENKCAVYLDGIPLDYFPACRADPSQKITKKSASFHLLAEPGRAAWLKIDNVTFWNLSQ